MSALQRLFSGHKRKANSLPNLPLKVSKPADDVISSPLVSPTQLASSPLSSSPVSSSHPTPTSSRSGSRVRHRKTDSDALERKAQEKHELEVKRDISYDSVSDMSEQLPATIDTLHRTP